MLKKIKQHFQKGFSIIEIMVFVTILNLVFVAAVSLVISSLFRMRVNIHRARAVFYAEELKEWLNGEREADWLGLSGRVGSTLCANNQLNLNTSFTDFATGTCPFTGVGANNPRIFRRRLTLTQSTPTQITAIIEVSWNESSANGSLQQFDETIQTVYTNW